MPLLLQESDLAGTQLPAVFTLDGWKAYFRYMAPVFGPFNFIRDSLTGNLTASATYYNTVKQYLTDNWFTETESYNVSVAIGRYYTSIQRSRDLTQTESNNADELLTLVESHTTSDTSLTNQTKVIPSGKDYGAGLPNPVNIPEFSPWSAVTDALLKMKWVFIGAGVLLTVWTGSVIYKNFKGGVK